MPIRPLETPPVDWPRLILEVRRAGYPRAVSLYQQRLYAAGTTGFPTTLSI